GPRLHRRVEDPGDGPRRTMGRAPVHGGRADAAARGGPGPERPPSAGRRRRRHRDPRELFAEDPMRVLLGLLVLLPSAADGWTTLKCGDEDVQVYRDSWGIPHVFARSPRAVFWAQGYAEAEDRFYQMDLFRRGARGQASELRGREAVANDRDRLRRGYGEEE